MALGSFTRCQAEARWGQGGYSTARDVTEEGTWSSSVPGAFVVDGPGRVRSVAPGEGELRCTFLGVSAAQAMRVHAGEPPVPVFYGHEASGWVRDPRLASPNNGIEGVTVEIIGGHDVGRTTVTNASGAYTFRDPVYGPVKYRARKAGYQDAVVEGFVGRTPSDAGASAAPTLFMEPIG
jgi:hypothetical protein